ncbi:MAG: coproporphyrinogen dehydrogenase HemZ [Tissierellia bacterium]|nr:coproporphyrinogen dehydrogenase HemZ [Tissierellia bacterium]
MIRIQGANHSEQHTYYELLRILFPTYEQEEDLFFTVDREQGYRVTAEIQNKRVVEEFHGEDDAATKEAVARWMVRELDLPKKQYSPWGILTGVRPIKFALLHDLSGEEGVRELVEHYLLDSLLAETVVKIADEERRRFQGSHFMKKGHFSLYINIPFCASRCSYCSFPTVVHSSRGEIHDYVSALLTELEITLAATERAPDTIYIGGGTPTSIPVGELERLLKALETHIPQGGLEFTVEAGRPDSLSGEMLALLAAHPVNRMSINPQTMKNETLERIGRPHTAEDILRSYDEARRMGDWSINMDLIVGLPGETFGDFQDTLEKIHQLGPDDLTIHALSLKNGSKIFEQQGVQIHPITEWTQYALRENLKKGYEPYYLYRQKRILGNAENIGYATRGHESLYNMIMMEELQTVLGVGMGATSKIRLEPEKLVGGRMEKFTNYRNLRDYMAHHQDEGARKVKWEDFL